MSRPAVVATRSSRSTSLIGPAIGTTWAAMRYRSASSCSIRVPPSLGEWSRISTSPLARACDSMRETDEREVCSSVAIASMVWSWR